MRLAPKPGFDWRRVYWGKPNETHEFCSCCKKPIDEDEIPLQLWSPNGDMAQFCDDCVAKWFVVTEEDN